MADQDLLVAAAVSASAPSVHMALETSEITTRDSGNDAAELPILNAPDLPTSATNGGGDSGDVHMTSGYSPEQVLAEDSASNNSNGNPTAQTGRQLSGAGMSLGALPIPRFNDPSTVANPEYAGLDAATPMNTTFLSTLAESPIDGGIGSSMIPRMTSRLDDVGEGEEEADEVRQREPADHLYT